MGLLFREHPKAQPEGGVRRSPGSNLRPLVYKASDLTTAPRRPVLYVNKPGPLLCTDTVSEIHFQMVVRSSHQ